VAYELDQRLKVVENTMTTQICGDDGMGDDDDWEVDDFDFAVAADAPTCEELEVESERLTDLIIESAPKKSINLAYIQGSIDDAVVTVEDSVASVIYAT